MVRTRTTQHARLAARAESVRLELVGHGLLPANSAWYFQYPAVERNTYSRPQPTSEPFPTSLVFVPVIRGEPQVDHILWQGCVHSCQTDCPTCRMTGPDFPAGRRRPHLQRTICLLWNHLTPRNGLEFTCPAPPDPTTGRYNNHTCLHFRG